MDTKFDFQKLEQDIYRKWEQSGAFTPTIQEGKKPFVVTMPPPNAYDQLHIGHALEVALQDVMVRYHRLKGEPTLWLPGADHAGLASQVFFEKKLEKEEGKSRFDLGREKFVEELAAFQNQKRKDTEAQLRKLGASCDWTRSKYTLDPDVSRAVVYTFKKMYDDGLIYRGRRVINWSPKSQTGLSDLEVVHKEVEGELVSIKYPIKEGGDITVATTRPETMLGDTAVAVNPADERYQSLIGKTVVLPLVNRGIPIVGDEAVDMAFGTGAVKVTPAHDPNDFEIANRHGLESIEVIDRMSRITEQGGDYAGMKVMEAREKIIADLETQGLIVARKKFVHSVPHSERSGEAVEQLLSEQWFVKTEPLAKRAMEVVESGKIKFLSEKFEKIYFNWMNNIRDWNISRQVWWGHRIPVYYLVGDASKFVVAFDEAEAKARLGGEVVQEEDTLDTWFSSGLWPFTTLGWPELTEDFKYFYPTSVMAPGWDIIFFWVARMIMLGLYCTDEIPFEYVYLHGLVRDAKGEKISRSKGNMIDPLEMVDKYGADALRMGLMMGAGVGNDTNISEEKIRAYRNFANKIWNAARFINMSTGEKSVSSEGEVGEWLTEFEGVKKEVTKLMEDYKLSLAGEKLYEYFWHRFCDELIEAAKPSDHTQKMDPAKAGALNQILQESLIMLHPFVPFATEAVWGELFEGMLITENWPKL